MLMKNKERAVGLVMATIISAAMGIIMAFLIRKGMTPQQLESSPPAPIMYLLNIVESLIAGIVLALLLPLGKWSRTLTDKVGVRPPSPWFFMLNSLPISLVNAIFVSFTVCFINVAQAHSRIPADIAPPLMNMFMSSWLGLLLPSTIIGYLLALIFSPIVTRIMGVGCPPDGIPPQDGDAGPGRGRPRGRIPGGPKPACISRRTRR